MATDLAAEHRHRSEPPPMRRIRICRSDPKLTSQRSVVWIPSVHDLKHLNSKVQRKPCPNRRSTSRPIPAVAAIRAGPFQGCNGLTVQAGDELMVLPKIEAKNTQITRGIAPFMYQIAVAATIGLGL